MQKLIQAKKNVLFNITLVLIMIYFVFHAIFGNRGIIAYLTLKEELRQSTLILNQLVSTRNKIENHTALLRPGSLDKDMLDEQIRHVLGLSDPTEKIFKTQLENTKPTKLQE